MKRTLLAALLLLTLASTALAQQDASNSGTITALSQCVQLDLNGFGTATVQVTGAWAATLDFETTVDGTYTGMPAIRVADRTVVDDTTANGKFVIAVSGFTGVQVCSTAFTSGTAAVSIVATASASTLPVAGGTSSNVAVTSSVLPTGAATEATLASVDGKLPALSSGRIPVVLPAGGGGLTDAELRASPVPVSGTVSTGGLTDTQLRATPVPVSGTVTATTGGLTDTQLRATAVPVTANAGTNLNTSALALSANQTNGTQQSKVTDGTDVADVTAASTAPSFATPALTVVDRYSVRNGDSIASASFERGSYTFGKDQFGNTARPIPVIRSNDLFSGQTMPVVDRIPVQVSESAFGNSAQSLGALNATADTTNYDENAAGAMVYIKNTGAFAGTITPYVLHINGTAAMPAIAYDQTGAQVSTLQVEHLYFVPLVRGYLVRVKVTAYTSGSASAYMAPTIHPIATYTAATIMNTVTVTGSVTTGGLTDAQLRASAVPVSAASLPLPTGASTSANQTGGNQKTQIVDGLGNVVPTVLDDNGARGFQVHSGVKAGDTFGTEVPLFPIGGVADSGGGAFVWSGTRADGVAPTVDGADVGLFVRQVGLPTAVTTADNTANQKLTAISNFNMVWDSSGTNWDRMLQPLTDTQLRATPVPVSGTVTANAGTGTFTVGGTVTANAGTNLNTSALALDATLTGGTQQTKLTDGVNVATVKAASTAAVGADKAVVVAVSPNNSVAITAASLPLPTGAATETTLSGYAALFPAAAALADNTANPTLTKMQNFSMMWDSAGSNWDRWDGRVHLRSGSGSAITSTGAYGTASAATGINVHSGVINGTVGTGAEPIFPVGGSVGGAVFVAAVAANTAPGSSDYGLVIRQVGLPVAAALADNVANPTLTSIQNFNMAWDSGGSNWDRMTQPLTDTQLRATPVPVSGTVTATQATATNLKAQAEVYQGGTAVGAAAPLQVSLANTGANATALTVAQATAANLNATVVQGTATNLKTQAENYQGGTAVSATNPLQVKDQRAATPAVTSVAGSATTVSCLASNANRLGAVVYNDSTADLYVKLGATASTSSFTVKLFTDGAFTVPFGYTGVIDCIWSSATGSARVTEVTQ